MSSRFHNKYHRHNHHTATSYDPRYPDSGYDPIASPESPFMGPFVMIGTLSATGIPAFSELSATPGGVFAGYPLALQAVAVSGSNIGTAINASGNIIANNNLTVAGNITAANVYFTGTVIQSYSTPITTTGEFLTINVNGSTRLIRLWNFQ